MQDQDHVRTCKPQEHAAVPAGRRRRLQDHHGREWKECDRGPHIMLMGLKAAHPLQITGVEMMVVTEKTWRNVQPELHEHSPGLIHSLYLTSRCEPVVMHTSVCLT